MRKTSAGFGSALLVGALLAAPATASAAPTPPGVRISQDATSTTMCGRHYCAVLDHDHRAVLTGLRVDGHEVLDPAQGVYSSVTTSAGTVTTQSLADPPSVAVTGDTVTVELATSVADETWTFRVGPDALGFTLARTYRAAAVISQQGTPAMTFAEDAFEQMRWPGDGGNFPVGGPLVDTYQPSWLAGGARYAAGLRTGKRQASYTMLNSTTGAGLAVEATTDHGATEVWRTANKDLRVATLASAADPRFKGGTSAGYGGHSTRDGSPVFAPVTASAGQRDTVTLSMSPADVASYYDLGDLRGVDEDALSHAINDYARWMMQDRDKGASTEQPQLQSEAPPFEMQWLGQLLELFPEPTAIHSFQTELGDIRDHMVQPSGRIYCCTPGGGNTFYGDYGDQTPGYVLGIAKAYQLSGDRTWLATMADSVRRSLDYLIVNRTDPVTHFVRNVLPDLGEADYNNDYWESSSGAFDGYATALLYDALTAWATLEHDVLGGDAQPFRDIAAAIKAAFNRDAADGGFWSPATHTFLYGTGNQDALYLPVNAEVLKTDLTTPQRRRQIVEAIEAQDAYGDYELHPMNVRDLYTPGATAPTAGKGGEDGAWYGAPDGDFYAGLSTVDDPQLLQTDIAGFLTRYRADGFYGASTWDRDKPLQHTGSAVYFPTTVMPAWGLYHYGYGFQPGDDRLTLAPYIAPGMLGSSVDYTWRGTPMHVRYLTQSSFQIGLDRPLTTPLTVEWINQRPGSTVHVVVDGHRTAVPTGTDGVASATLPVGARGMHTAVCTDCAEPGQASTAPTTAMVRSYRPGPAAVRNDAYQPVGARIAVGPQAITVSSLSRYKLAGNHLPHRLALLDADGHVVASTTVDMSARADRDGFVHARLARPVTIAPGIYHLYSSETPGGDTWYDAGGSVTTSDGITVLAAASGRVPATAGGPGDTFGPVSLDYQPTGPQRMWLQEFVAPTSTSARSGGTVTLQATVWAQADRPVTGTITPSLPAGWTTDPATFTIDTHGRPASSTVPVTLHVPADAATPTDRITLAASAGSLGSSQTVTVSVANILYDFDDGTTQGWQAVAPAGGVAAVTSILNGPGIPYAGSHLLQAGTGRVNGPNDPRTLYVEPATPLDLSNASTFYVHVDSYGIPPYTQTHQVTITLHSGTDAISSTTQFEANIWNRADIDVSSWPGRSHVTRIDVTYTLDTASPTNAEIDLDSVGYDAS